MVEKFPKAFGLHLLFWRELFLQKTWRKRDRQGVQETTPGTLSFVRRNSMTA